MMDGEDDRKLSLEDILVLTGVEGNEKERIAMFLKLADKGNKGHITAQEVKSVLTFMEEDADDEDARMFFAIADANGDRKLQTEEVINFLHLWRKMLMTRMQGCFLQLLMP